MKRIVKKSVCVREYRVNIAKGRVTEYRYLSYSPYFVDFRTFCVEDKRELHHSLYYDTDNDFVNYCDCEASRVSFDWRLLPRPKYFRHDGRPTVLYHDL